MPDRELVARIRELVAERMQRHPTDQPSSVRLAGPRLDAAAVRRGDTDVFVLRALSAGASAARVFGTDTRHPGRAASLQEVMTGAEDLPEEVVLATVEAFADGWTKRNKGEEVSLVPSGPSTATELADAMRLAGAALRVQIWRNDVTDPRELAIREIAQTDLSDVVLEVVELFERHGDVTRRTLPEVLDASLEYMEQHPNGGRYAFGQSIGRMLRDPEMARFISREILGLNRTIRVETKALAEASTGSLHSPDM